MLGGDEPLALPGEVTNSRRKWWIIGALVAVVIIAVAAYFAFRSGGDEAPGAGAGAGNAQIPTISVATPGRQTIQRVVSGTGSLAAKREMPVGVAGEGGMVTRVLVEAGSWVRSGQVLATVDRSVQVQTAESLSAQVRAARADAQLAQQQLERAQQLVGRGFISKADVDQRIATRDSAQARVRVAEATLAETRARNGRLDIRSPAAGLVLTRAVEPGQIVSSGSGTLFRIAKDGEMEMRAQLSEADLQRIRAGVPAEVTPVGTTQTFKGQVWQVSPVIDPQTRQGIARVQLAYDPALRPGGFATARVIAGATVAPLLPQSAVLSDAKGTYVYVIDAENKAQRRAVTTGELSDNGITVTGGLTGTERVVLTAGAFLNPGQKVIPNQTTLKR